MAIRGKGFTNHFFKNRDDLLVTFAISILMGCKGPSIGGITMPSVAPNPSPAPYVYEPAPRNDILIVVNKNSPESLALGQYYASARKINNNRIAEVYVSTSQIVGWSEFKSLRDQILKYMQENTFASSGVPPMTCSSGESQYYCANVLQHIRENTTIRYIAMMKGMPSRMYVDGSTLFGPDLPTSVDNYLRLWLANYYDADYQLYSNNKQESDFKDGSGFRWTNPKLDLKYGIGRIEGLDFLDAKSLIDRTMLAERQGLFGSFNGIQYGTTGYPSNTNWRNYSNFALNYTHGPSLHTWPLALGIWNETDPACISPLAIAHNVLGGKIPEHCKVKFYHSQYWEPPPGMPDSRVLKPVNAVAWIGELAPQSTLGSFSNLLNWRRDPSCTITLCEQASDPVACRARSKDYFKEINTECVGVAPGFVGTNYVSYSASHYHVYPTDWHFSRSSTFIDTDGGGDGPLTSPPVVRTDTGVDDNYSVWFGQESELATPLCFSSLDLTASPNTACRAKSQAWIFQNVSIPAVNLTIPQTYRVRFFYKTEDFSESPSLRVMFFAKEQGKTTVEPYGDANGYNHITNLISPNQDWTLVEWDVILNPAKQTGCASPCLVDGLRFGIVVPNNFSGRFALDSVSLKNLADGIELAKNGSFQDGHKSVVAGDYGSNFLSRLGGVAYFGSLSHHQSGGNSFVAHNFETFLYFIKGLPLGDATWFGEVHNSGIVYGDPAYSPVRVRIFRPGTDPQYRLQQDTPIYGDAINGFDRNLVSTTHKLSYCAGGDFYDCDLSNSWIDVAPAVEGGGLSKHLGVLKLTGLVWGQLYQLRLQVTSRNISTNELQTFNDYTKFYNWNGCDPFNTLPQPPGPIIWADSDNDGVGNPCDTNDDNDGYLDLNDPEPLNPNIPAPFPITGLIWSDDFNRANQSITTSGHWTSTYSPATGLIDSNKVRRNEDYPDVFEYWKVKSDIENAYVTVDVNGKYDYNYFMAIPRYQVTGDFYGCALLDLNLNGTAEILIVDQSWSVLAETETSIPTNSTSIVTLGCEINSSGRITSTINGATINSIVLPNVSITQGHVAFWQSGDDARTDNFKYYDQKP